MKFFLGTMFLVAAANMIGCVGTAADEEAVNAAGVTPATEQAEETKTEQIRVEEPRVEERTTVSACTAAELAACRRQDPFGSGCEIYNGKVVCLFE
jgi:hypothetical protein